MKFFRRCIAIINRQLFKYFRESHALCYVIDYMNEYVTGSLEDFYTYYSD